MLEENETNDKQIIIRRKIFPILPNGFVCHIYLKSGAFMHLIWILERDLEHKLSSGLREYFLKPSNAQSSFVPLLL